MVVFARPRDGGCGDVTLEEDDVIEDYLERPYVELLGDTADSSTLQRSLSARVRRRERVGMQHEGKLNAAALVFYALAHPILLFRSDLQTSLAPCSERCPP